MKYLSVGQPRRYLNEILGWEAPDLRLATTLAFS